jgi:serine/threonine-protein kinase
MRLDAWLKQEHTPAERLQLVERLGQALNAVHDRGEVLAALDPDHVEVGGDLRCDLSPAVRGRPEPGYAAPERLEGGPPSTAADIYAAGALCWEILAGRPCGEAPKPLPEVVPDLPRELANSVMGCLERSPEWRPKDLTYLAQLAAVRQRAVSASEAPTPRAAQPARAAGTPRTPQRRASRSHLPLIIAALLLVAAATSSYLWLRQQAAPARATSAARPPAAAPTPAPAATAETAPTPAPSTTAPAVAPGETPAPAPSSAPRAAATLAPAAAPEPVPTPTPTPTPAPAVVAEPQAPPETAPEPIEPALLTTLSPLSVRRPGRVLLDIRGSGLRSDQHARVLPIKEIPRGITVIRQKWVSSTLVNVLLELDGTVAPATYAIALEDASGGRTNPLQLTVTK